MSGDFPAAHSMDTTWFAIDRCGHVAVLHSGEEGAVVDGAPHVEGAFDAEELRAGELTWAIENGVFRPARHETSVSVHEERRYKDGGTTWSGKVEGKGIVVHSAYGFYLCGPVASREAVLAKNATGRQSPTPAYYDLKFGETDGRPWGCGVLTSLAWNWMHSRPDHCLGCRTRTPVGLEERCRIHRIFTYECSNYGNPPYDREENPESPILWDELDRRFGGALPKSIPAFPQFCFAEKPVLQPIQWLKSHSYDRDGWIREDGKSVAFGGPDDFPAAHSMDTDWFAVDRDGHVGCFLSGQGGAVPADQGRGWSYLNLIDELQSWEPTKAYFDPEGYRISDDHPHLEGPDPIIIFPMRPGPLAEEARAGRALPLSTREGSAFLWTGAPLDVWNEVHQGGGCRGCFHSRVWRLPSSRERWNDPAMNGVFVYETTWQTMCVPYGRMREPEPALLVERHHPAVRKEALLHRFGGLCFLETVSIQPLDFFECQTLGPARLDGKIIRAIRGQEKEFLEDFDQHAENARGWGLSIERPNC